VVHSLHVNGQNLWRCCQAERMANVGHVSRVGGSGNEGDTGTTLNMNSERNDCLLMYSYRNKDAM
jgi:hypothetical protein